MEKYQMDLGCISEIAEFNQTRVVEEYVLLHNQGDKKALLMRKQETKHERVFYKSAV